MKKFLTAALALVLCAAMTITAGLQLASAAEIPDLPLPTETVEPIGPKDPDKGGETPAKPDEDEFPDIKDE